MATHALFLPGESQGRGAWWAAVCGVAQSRTRLKRLGSSSSTPLFIPTGVCVHAVTSVMSSLRPYRS